MDDVNEDVWPLEDSMIQLQFVIVMVNGLMSKMVDLHSELCETCKAKSDPDHELVRKTRVATAHPDQRYAC